MLEMVCHKDACGRWYVSKMVCDKDVCERLCVKDGVLKMVCECCGRVRMMCVKDGV